MRTRRSVVMLVSGLMALLVSIVGAGPPAGAAEYSANTTVALTFVDNNGQGRTCNVYVEVERDSTAKTASASLFTGGPSPTCHTGSAAVSMVLAYKDEANRARSARMSGWGSSSLMVDGVASSVQLTFSVSYYSCNPGASATCSLNGQTATK